MSEKYILYNPCAGGPETEKAVKALQDANEGAVAINICRIISYKTFFNGLDPNDTVILCGGDGTLNRFVNDVNGMNIPNKLYYYPTGPGNDFARDVGQKPFSARICRSSPDSRPDKSGESERGRIPFGKSGGSRFFEK